MMMIKTIPSIKPIMFISFNTIYISYNYLSITTDRCLQAGIYHELGHRDHVLFRKMFAILFIYMTIFVPLFLVSKSTILFLIPFSYVFFCWVARLREFHADLYAFRHTDLDSMREFLMGEGSRMDTKLLRVFFLFRWHPNSAKRYSFLCKVGGIG